jgi:O-antigen ligase
MIKWPLIVLLLFDGCRTRGRIKLALVCICLFFALFTVQIAMSMERSALSDEDLMHELRMDLPEKIGITSNGAGKMMSGVPWAMLTLMPLLGKRKYRFVMLGPCVASMYTIAVNGSRSSYIACGATLVLLCLVRWRRYLVLLPLAVLIVPIVAPGVRSRMLMGFGETNVHGEKVTDMYDVTAGRNLMWPVVISKICESPVFGFGRESVRRTGVRDKFAETGRSIDVGHPHNAYLEVLLDSGLIGFVIIVGLHIIIWVYSARLFVDRGDPLYTAVGGFTLALLTGHLVAFMGGQSFYPEGIDVGLWCAIGLMLRLYVGRGRLVAKANAPLVANMLITRGTVAPQTPMGWAKS